MPGCGIYECEKKDFDAAEFIINKDSATQSVEGAVESPRLTCNVSLSPLQGDGRAKNRRVVVKP